MRNLRQTKEKIVLEEDGVRDGLKWKYYVVLLVEVLSKIFNHAFAQAEEREEHSRRSWSAKRLTGERKMVEAGGVLLI